jgi:hypothetical protein
MSNRLELWHAIHLQWRTGDRFALASTVIEAGADA